MYDFAIKILEDKIENLKLDINFINCHIDDDDIDYSKKETRRCKSEIKELREAREILSDY